MQDSFCLTFDTGVQEVQTEDTSSTCRVLSRKCIKKHSVTVLQNCSLHFMLLAEVFGKHSSQSTQLHRPSHRTLCIGHVDHKLFSLCLIVTKQFCFRHRQVLILVQLSLGYPVSQVLVIGLGVLV